MNGGFKTLALIMALLMLALAVTSCIGGKTPKGKAENTNFPLSPELTRRPDITFTEEPEFTPEPTIETGDYRRSTLYYLTDEGYILPVTVDIPWEAGIAKACLAKLVSSPANRIETQQKGLKAPIPEGTVIEINIADNKATVNLKNMPPVLSAEGERAMFTAIVNTLTGFNNVKTVSVLINGRNGRTANGVEMPDGHGSYALNAENAEVAVSGNAKPLFLFFPNDSGSHIIPVTRYTEGAADLYAAISGIIGGTTLPELRNCFPKDTLLLAATVENGVLSLNLTSDFEAIAEIPGVFELAKQTALMTARQYGEVNEVRFFVNGTLYAPETE